MGLFRQTRGSIYCVTNVISGKFYIGQTWYTPTIRWSVHCSDAKKRARSYFHKAIRKYGPSSFRIEVLSTADNQPDLNRLETAWIVVTGAHRHGYNLSLGGGFLLPTPETRAKQSAAHLGRRASSETRAKMSATRKGRPQTLAHRAARSAALLGRTPSLAARLAVAESNRRRARKAGAC